MLALVKKRSVGANLEAVRVMSTTSRAGERESTSGGNFQGRELNPDDAERDTGDYGFVVCSVVVTRTLPTWRCASGAQT